MPLLEQRSKPELAACLVHSPKRDSAPPPICARAQGCLGQGVGSKPQDHTVEGFKAMKSVSLAFLQLVPDAFHGSAVLELLCVFWVCFLLQGRI